MTIFDSFPPSASIFYILLPSRNRHNDEARHEAIYALVASREPALRLLGSGAHYGHVSGGAILEWPFIKLFRRRITNSLNLRIDWLYCCCRCCRRRVKLKVQAPPLEARREGESI